MSNEWMIDVLADLRKFAAQQAMLELAEHLDDAIMVAAVEIRNHSGGGMIGVSVNDNKAGNVFGTVGSNQHN